NIMLRHKIVKAIRDFLDKENFIEIETPILAKSTPEGARDYIVPSRNFPGQFFALPQSPQTFKQLLRVAGFDKYFQIARCFRDEDLRADRQPEFTQIDVEMSFVEREDVMQMIEQMMIAVGEALGYTIKKKPFPRFTYKEAMDKFGDDKFDLRSDKEKKAGDVLAYAWVIDYPFFEKTGDGGWTFTHNPFSNPLPEFMEDHLAGKNIEKILTSQYDLVCNGYESGGGSIRAHRPEVLRATYKIMDYSDKEIKQSVGHMLEAFKYGAPPHGGIALGLDRLVMVMAGEDSLREVQAFPMTGGGNTAVMDAPSEVPKSVLKELHIKIEEE
ncbi:aspartate--tRNA ligase, partial [Patescibacteria group bacterium]|nr:aspartate--tRNA ligase [Patescibacteria group bacterium]